MTKHSTTPEQKHSFAKWLEGQLDFRKWKAADLAKHSNLSESTICLFLHAQRAPEPVSCKKLASGLGLPVDLVYEQAGYMLTGPESLSSPKRSLIELVKRMPDADALRLLARSQARMVIQADGKWWA